MNPLGELFIKISADIKGLKTGLKGAETSMGKFSASIKKHSKAISMAMIAMGTAILAAGIMSVKAFAKMGDEVAKMAIRTGFSTEALSELRHAADLSGTSLLGVEKASRTLSSAIIDANEGLVSYQRAFERIRLSYKELAKMKPEQQFLAVLEALAATEDATIRTTTASDLFGARLGTQLLPMLENGVEGLRDMRQEAHDLNLVFSQESANAARDFNDSITRIGGALKGLQFTIAQVVMPSLQEYLDGLDEISKATLKWAEENPKLTETLVKLTGAGVGLLVAIGGLGLLWPILAKGIGLLATAMALLLTPIGLIISGFAAIAGISIWTTNKIEKLAEATFGLGYGTSDMVTALDKSFMAFKTDAFGAEKLAEALKYTTNVFERIGAEIKKTTEKTDKQTKALKDLYGTKDTGRDWMYNTVLAFQKIGLAAGEAARRIREMKGWMGAFGAAPTWGGGAPGRAPILGEPIYEDGRLVGWREPEPEPKYIPGIYEHGGIVPGPIGRPIPVIAHGGEQFLGAGQYAPTIENYITVPVYLDGEIITTRFLQLAGDRYMERQRMGG